ncbi:MAG: hypothetical protein ACFFAN_18870, partial [Promethearchaeota archaeon]
SYGLSVFDSAFFELSTLMEEYLNIFNCLSLIIFDKNGIIISEYYSNTIEPNIYLELLENVKEHLFLLKRMQEEQEPDYNFFSIGDKILSYLHKIEYKKYWYYVSVLIEEDKKESLLEKFSDLINEIMKIFKKLFR